MLNAMGKTMKLLLAAVMLFSMAAAHALDLVEAKPSGTSLSGHMTGATDFQFGVMVSGTLEQKIEQLEREARLLRFARDSFPQLLKEIRYSGTNQLMSKCLTDLTEMVKKPIPMELGTNDFRAKEFAFEKVPLLTALKYLVAFDDSILDVSGGKLVCRPVRQALGLKESDYNLLHLMKNRQFGEVERILEQTIADVSKVQDQDGRTLLHLAAGQNQTSIAKRLIELGVDLNSKDHVGYTPLHEAVRDGHRECAELLLKSGADTTIADNNENTALETATYFGYLELARLLVDNGAAPDIFTASGLGMVVEVRKLLDQADEWKQAQPPVTSNQSPIENIYSIDFNTRRKGPGGYYQGFGVTPLHWAARGGSVEVAALLVSRGASVTAEDSRGETALFWAASEGRLNTAKFLVEHGANLNTTNTFGATPLLTAARQTVNPSLIKFMIAAGADINARDTEGENALHKLAWFGCPEENIETARMLIDAGADINARNNDGKTPLEVLLNNSLRNENLVQLYRKHAGNKPSKL